MDDLQTAAVVQEVLEQQQGATAEPAPATIEEPPVLPTRPSFPLRDALTQTELVKQ
jgi:hypothetical protein